MRLITKCFRFVDPFPALIEHYFGLGYSHIEIAADPESHSRLRAMCPPNVRLYSAFADGYTSAENSIAAFRIQKAVAAPDEWVGISDLDEFHEYPMPLPALLTKLEAEGANAFVGKLIDHVANDGLLRPITGNPFDEFPVTCNLTEALAGACSRKIMLVKGYLVPADGGYHFAQGEHPAKLKGYIHHFKWTSSLLERLKLRVADKSAAREFSRAESEKILAHIDKHKRIALDAIPHLKLFAPNRGP